MVSALEIIGAGLVAASIVGILLTRRLAQRPDSTTTTVRVSGRTGRRSTGETAGRVGRTVAVCLVGVLMFWLLQPAADGFHVGYNWTTDHQGCVTRVLQWCK